MLFCIPSLVATGGVHEFARLAKGFGGTRQLVAVPVPGFGLGETLPSTLDAAAAAQAGAIIRHAEGRRFAIVGYSTGGLLAHAVACQCASEHAVPSAVVLIDSYTIETMGTITGPVFDRMLASDGPGPAITEETLLAMGTYLGMLSRWTPPAAVAPTLLLKAGRPLRGVVGGDADWKATWTARHEAVTISATHLSALEDDVSATVAAIEDWLRRHSREHPRRRLRPSRA
jgi:thioesterase domain-containing protein